MYHKLMYICFHIQLNALNSVTSVYGWCQSKYYKEVGRRYSSQTVVKHAHTFMHAHIYMGIYIDLCIYSCLYKVSMLIIAYN